MVVPSFTAKGGITAVVNGYQNSQLTEDYDVRFIETYCDGNKIKKVAIYLKSMFKYLYALIFWRAEIIHIHSSFGGSFYRKKFFIPLELGGGILNENHSVVINSIKENKVLVTKRIFKNGNKCGLRKSKAIIV